MTTTANQALTALSALRDPDKAAFFQRFFKCAAGQYGEGDQFLGLTVPQVRGVLAQYRTMPLQECVQLLHSPFNEARLLAVLALVSHYQRKRATDAQRQDVFDAYLAHRAQVNNWNLVDSSAPHIVGGHLLKLGPRPARRTGPITFALGQAYRGSVHVCIHPGTRLRGHPAPVRAAAE
jgi:hypothetical protein